MTAQALESGKKAAWTLIMVGGGHFAAAVFLGKVQKVFNIERLHFFKYL